MSRILFPDKENMNLKNEMKNFFFFKKKFFRIYTFII